MNGMSPQIIVDKRSVPPKPETGADACRERRSSEYKARVTCCIHRRGNLTPKAQPKSTTEVRQAQAAAGDGRIEHKEQGGDWKRRRCELEIDPARLHRAASDAVSGDALRGDQTLSPPMEQKPSCRSLAPHSRHRRRAGGHASGRPIDSRRAPHDLWSGRAYSRTCHGVRQTHPQAPLRSTRTP